MEHIPNDSEASKGSDNEIDNEIDSLIDEYDSFDDDDSEHENCEYCCANRINVSINTATLKDVRDVLYNLREYFNKFEIDVGSCPPLTARPYNFDFNGLSGLNILEQNFPMEKMTNITPLDESDPVRPIRLHTKYKFFTEDRPGMVLEMYARGRKTNQSIITLMQNILHRRFSHKMGLGGILIVKGGQLLQYNPKFTCEATYHHIKCDSEITCSGAIVNDPVQILGHHDGLLMTTNRYMFDIHSEHGNGFFVNDITPKETEYYGIFNVADAVCRW
ncbi:ester hydrolase c11orf54-like protein [Lasius niger]|uniref:Ester hydrolase c11orf54-like protein n=1 Tax=Lasius niger TaxID=67767 RepID=A0A0J7K1W2_LASNI|nr:ester hydrolase c11orf54-like protein [Lasius niger]